MFATPFRKVWFVSLALLVASLACSALAQSSTPSSAEVRDRYQRAQTALRANDPVTAEKEFRAVLTLDPRNSGAHTGIGILDMGRGDWRAASDEFRFALAAQPAFTKALSLLGICQKRLGDPSARASLEKAFRKLEEKSLRVQVGMELSGLYEQQGDMEAAAALMGKLVELDPENPDILFVAQRIYSDLAEDTLNKLAVVAPGSARMQQAIAEKLINVGDLKGAIDHYRKALQIDPRLPGIHYELGEAILESGRTDAATQAEAQKELEASIVIDGDTAKTECALAEIALLQSASDRALAHYQRAYQLNSNEVQAQMGLANLAMHENPREAVKYLRMVVESDPLNGSAHYQLARAYQRLQMNDLADKELHLSQEIRKTKEQVEGLYHQMNRYKKPEMYEGSEKETVGPKPDGRN
jgi:Tfp pilus assembly protein PilF